MSILENLEVGASVKTARRTRRETLDWVYEVFPVLKARSGQKAGTLSGGEQQMLAIGRALMSRPRLLLVDEMSLGLSPVAAQSIAGVIRQVNASRMLTILLVEQDVQLALSLAHRGYVIENGRIVGEGVGCRAPLQRRDQGGLSRHGEQQPMSAVIQALLIGILVGALYSLVALGFGLIMGVMRFVNIAHGSFIIIGGYIAYWLFTLWGIDPYLSIPAVMVCMFVLGLLLYRLALAPLLKYPRAEMRMDKSLLITFGVTWILDNAVTLIWTPDTRSIITSYSGSTINIFGARLGLVGLTGLVIAVLIAVSLHLLLTRTYFGKHVRAATEDSGAAALSGVNVQRTYLISCGIAAALAGVAGVVIVSSYSIAPSGGLNWLLTAMVVIVLAGEGNITAYPPGRPDPRACSSP